MSSFSLLALLLALGVAAASATLAQSSSSSSNPTDQAQPETQQPAAQSQGAISVQARIKARRAKRRAAAIHEAYSNRYEAYTGFAYLRFVPGPGTPAIAAAPPNPAVPHGPGLEHAHEYGWNVGATRYFSERLGVTADIRGYYGTAYVYPNSVINGINNPAVSQYAFMAGPTYRFYLHPRYSISGRLLAGVEKGDFSGDTNHSSALATELGLWPDSYVFAFSASIPVEYNLTPKVALRVAPEYLITGFGSTEQYTRGFSSSLVYRIGKK